jgi:ABC-2 type transport system permease protein
MIVAMVTSTRTELLKLRTIRLPLGLLATGAGLTAMMAVLTAARAGGPGSMAADPLDTAAGLTGVLATTYFAMLMAMVFGVTIATGEFRHQTATATYLATPDRVRVLAAKAIAAAGFGLLFGLVGAAITTGIGLGFVAAKGYPVTLPATTIARYAAGAVLGAGLLAALGVALGSLLRAQLGAVITVFVYGLLGETILGGLFHPIAPYLPYTAATAMAGSPPPGGTPLPFAAAAALLIGVAALICAVAARTSVQADIT